jgi:hypothetical protein
MVTVWERGEEFKTLREKRLVETLEFINNNYGAGDIVRIIEGTNSAFVAQKQYGQDVVPFAVMQWPEHTTVIACSVEAVMVTHDERRPNHPVPSADGHRELSRSSQFRPIPGQNRLLGGTRTLPRDGRPSLIFLLYHFVA